MKKLLITLMAVVLVAGCANKDARIAKRTARLQSETAFALGVDKDSVQIANVTGNMSGYRWQATTGGRTYNCAMYGGNFMSFGSSTVPDCNPVSKAASTSKKSKKQKEQDTQDEQIIAVVFCPKIRKIKPRQWILSAFFRQYISILLHCLMNVGLTGFTSPCDRLRKFT